MNLREGLGVLTALGVLAFTATRFVPDAPVRQRQQDIVHSLELISISQESTGEEYCLNTLDPVTGRAFTFLADSDVSDLFDKTTSYKVQLRLSENESRIYESGKTPLYLQREDILFKAPIRR